MNSWHHLRELLFSHGHRLDRQDYADEYPGLRLQVDPQMGRLKQGHAERLMIYEASLVEAGRRNREEAPRSWRPGTHARVSPRPSGRHGKGAQH